MIQEHNIVYTLDDTHRL